MCKRWKMWIILPEGYFHRRFRERISTAKKRENIFRFVDIVDNSGAQQFFADFYHIPGAHSYQQITVYAIFQ